MAAGVRKVAVMPSTPLLLVALALVAVYAAFASWRWIQVSRIASSALSRAEELSVSLKGRLDVQGVIYRERDQWKALYQDQALAHGRAQDMLVTEREALCRQLMAAGQTPRTNPVIDSVVSSFQAEHVEPNQPEASDA